MTNDKPDTRELLAVALNSGSTALRTARRTERADYVVASANADRQGQYEALGSMLIFLDAIHPDRGHDAVTVAEGPVQVEFRHEGDKRVAVEMERRRVHLKDRIAAEKEEAIELLFSIVRKDRVCRDFEDDTVRFLARLAFVEWLHRVCPTCRGAKHGKNDVGVVVICPTCHGTGLRRFSDLDRCQAIGCDRNELRRWGKTLDRLSGIIGESMRMSSKAVAKMVNNW